jgi:hypothetical protein
MVLLRTLNSDTSAPIPLLPRASMVVRRGIRQTVIHPEECGTDADTDPNGGVKSPECVNWQWQTD